MKFDKEKIMCYKTVIHCKTKEHAIELLSWADSINLTWNSQDRYIDNNRWHFNKHTTCYNLHDGKYDSLRFYKKLGFNILKFEDVIIKTS